MKVLFACFCVSSLAFGQAGARAGALGAFAGRSFAPSAYPITSPTAAPALGGLPVSSRPLGGVPVPGARKQNRNSGSGYIGPIYYVPGSSDYALADFWNPLAQAPANTGYAEQPPAPLQPPPVIINQYFDSRHSRLQAEDTPPAVEDSTLKPGDPIAPSPEYYLIEYKDHSIYSALAYWLEGDTLHYVTTQNTHNQASLSLIDLDKTYKLNQDRSVPFSIPGK